MGVRTCESRCLFSGSKGEVCCIEPLHAKVELRDHPITQYSLLAMASLTKVTCCLQKALCEKSPRNKILLYTQMFYFVFVFFEDTSYWPEAISESVDDFSLWSCE